MLRVACLMRRWTRVRSCLFKSPSAATASPFSAGVVVQQKMLYGEDVEDSYEAGKGTLRETMYTRVRMLDECAASVKRGSNHYRSTVINLMKLCATSMVYENPAGKVQLAETFFKEFSKTGMKLDVGMYNLLLRVYNYNEHKFVPSEFVNRMKQGQLQPNLGTFNQLIDAYCIQGNVHGASKLLEFMKNHELPISEDTYASLVTGHSRAGNLAAAEGVLSTMKANRHRANNAVYINLLCAYAERGLIEKIRKASYRMKVEKIFPSMRTYLVVMDALSKHGHGDLVPDVLSLIKNDSWLIPDLRIVAQTCMARGEIDAPLCIMSHLSQYGAVPSFLIARYFLVAFARGLSVSASLAKLEEHIDISSFKWIVQTLTCTLLSSEFICLGGDCHELPERGRLPPLSRGVSWCVDVRECLRMLSREKDVWEYHFYPLLARHCSDGDIQEMIRTYYVMVDLDCIFHSNGLANPYIEMTFSNSEFETIEGYISSLNLEKEYDEQWLVEHVVFLCSLNRWEDAFKLLEKLDQEGVEKHKRVLSMSLYSVSNSEKTRRSCVNFVLALYKHIQNTNYFPYNCCWIDRKLNMSFLTALLNQGIEISLDPIIGEYKELCHGHVLENPSEIWKLLDMAKYYTPKDKSLLHLYQCAVKLFAESKVDSIRCTELYDLMTEEQKNLYDTRCFHILHMLGTKDFETCKNEFLSLVAEERFIPVLIWKRMICATYDHDPILADDLMEKMKKHKLSTPDFHMLYDLMGIHCRHRDFSRAEEILKIYKELKKGSERGGHALMTLYEPILELWSHSGYLDKINEIDATVVMNNDYTRQARVIALIHNKKYSEAMEKLQEIHSFPRKFLLTLLKTLVPNKYKLYDCKKILVKKGVKINVIDSMLFFILIDYNFIMKAKLLLKNLKVIDQEEMDIRMKSPRSEKYQTVLRDERRMVREPRLSLSKEGKLPNSNVVFDFKDLHGKLLDVDPKS